MSSQRLQVGIDFSRKSADICLMHPEDGDVIEMHRCLSNAPAGFEAVCQLVNEALETYELEGVDISAEATGFYWLPFYLALADDAQLQAQDLQLFVHNPLQVHWFKRSLPKDDKTDARDPFYIADRTRTRRPKVAWSPQTRWMPLRFYTRQRYHLAQNLTRQKNFYQNYLFLLHCGYNRSKPFSDTFGVTSRRLLSQPQLLSSLAALPLDDLAAQLGLLSNNALRSPLDNAQRLKEAMASSFSLPPLVAQAAQRVLDLTLQRIDFFEKQISQVEQWIVSEMHHSVPEALVLSSPPGIGLVFASGIAAEIAGLDRFFQGLKWDNKRKSYRPKNLRDVEDSVAKYAGLWWPRRSSGDFDAQDRHLSKQGNRYLRYYLIEAADRLRQHIPAYSRFYDLKYRQASKHHHKRALVLTARKALGLLVGLLHRQEPFRLSEAD